MDKVLESLVAFFAPAELVVNSSDGADASVDDQELLSYYSENADLLKQATS